MSTTTYAHLLTEMQGPSQLTPYSKTATVATGTHWNSTWIAAGLPAAGSTPSSAIATTSATVGAIGQTNPSGGASSLVVYLRNFDLQSTGGGTISGALMLVDRLSQMGGLSGIVTTAQTVSTAALTRYTSGAGVWAAIEDYTSVGATGTTATISYTNQAGTAGQTSQPTPFGGAGFSNTPGVFPISLAAGDTGVQAVSTLTLAATTGTAGSFGVTLFYTLGIWPIMTLPYAHRGDGIDLSLPIPAIPNNACLELLLIGGGQFTGLVGAELCFLET